MQTPNQPIRYSAYLLRCWTEQSAHAKHAVVWRFSIEDTHTGARQGFASFDLLLDFLRTQLRIEPPNGDQSSETLSD